MSPTTKKRYSTTAASNTSTSPTPATTTTTKHTFDGRDGLGAYLRSPESFPIPSVVLYHTPSFVTIHDAYPKSSMHLLLLPHTALSMTHPLTALSTDAALLEACKAEVAKATALMASAMRQRFGQFSASERARRAALEAGIDPDDPALPAGRDWAAEVLAGVHAGPSMKHVHVHVLSRDRHSACVKHRKHYQSFATPFLVRLDEFPLPEGDARWRPDHGGFLRDDMRCWRCGRNFGNRFKELKAHLDEEFEEWKRE